MPRNRLCFAPNKLATAEEAVDAALGATAKHPTTSAKRPRALARLVSACTRLPARSPSQFTKARKAKPPTATHRTCPTRRGYNPAENSPRAIARYAVAIVGIIESQQPITNPIFSPKARRAYTYQPPTVGSIVPSSATELVHSSV